jgi:hypothetical protein
MQIKAIGSSLLLAAGLAGCAASTQQDAAPVAASSSALTVQECGTQRDTCLSRNFLLGIFICPAQYTQCVATASNGIPAQVTSAIQDVADCVETARLCRMEAPNQLATCAADQAACVAAIGNVRLPPIVDGTAMCVDQDVACIRAAKTVNDLATCGQTFQSCAVDQAVSALPPAVGTVVRDVTDCLTTLGMCTTEAASASAITQCGQDEVSCVADSLGVPLAQPPVAEAVRCAETAANCGQHATSAAAVRTCAANFTQCNADLAAGQLSCAQKWTACLGKNPLNFIGCAAEFASCTSG